MAIKACPRCKTGKMFHTAKLCKRCKRETVARCIVCGKKLKCTPFHKSKTGHCKKCFHKHLASSYWPHSSELGRYARSFGKKAKVRKSRYCKDCGIQIKSKTAKYCRKCVCAYRPNRFDDPEERKKQSVILKSSTNVKRGRQHHWFRVNREAEYTRGWTKDLQTSIKKRDGGSCCLCGSDRLLRVHHIDFGKSDHVPSNLATVCMSCHSRIHALFDPKDSRAKKKSLPRIKPVNSVKTFMRQYRAKLFPKGD